MNLNVTRLLLKWEKNVNAEITSQRRRFSIKQRSPTLALVLPISKKIIKRKRKKSESRLRLFDEICNGCTCVCVCVYWCACARVRVNVTSSDVETGESGANVNEDQVSWHEHFVHIIMITRSYCKREHSRDSHLKISQCSVTNFLHSKLSFSSPNGSQNRERWWIKSK